MIYFGWTHAALVLPAAVAAGLAAVLADRFRLLVALIAAGATVLVGFYVLFALNTLDGCVGPLTVFQSSCNDDPNPIRPNLKAMYGSVFAMAAIAAVAAAAAVSLIRRARAPGAGPRSTTVSGPSTARRRWAVGVLSVLAAIFVMAKVVPSQGTPAPGRTNLDPSQSAQALRPANAAAVSPDTRAWQVLAWYSFGGADLIRRIGDSFHRGADVIDAIADGRTDISAIRPICADFGVITGDATGYFRVPDLTSQSIWQPFIAQLGKASQDCVNAVDRHDRARLEAALQEISDTAGAVDSLDARLDTVLSDDLRAYLVNGQQRPLGN